MKKITQLLAVVVCCVLMFPSAAKAENEPSNIFFSLNAGSGWTYDNASTKTTDNGATVWYYNIGKPKNTDIFMHISNTKLNTSDWNNIVNRGNTLYMFDNSSGKDGNAKTTYNTDQTVYLWESGPGKCIQVAGCPTDKEVRVQITYKDGNVTLKVVPTGTEEKPVEKEYTIYFYDRGNANADHKDMKVHVWGDSGEYKAWADNETVTSTGKFFKINNVYFPVWKYTFTWDKTPKYVKFHDSAEYSNQDFADGRVYSFGDYNTSLSAADLVEKDAPVAKEYTIYFWDKNNLGSVRAHIWDKDGNPYKTMPSDDENMTATGKYVNKSNDFYPVYSYTFTWDKEPSGVHFYKTGYGDKQTGDASFLNNAFYTNGTTRYELNLTLVDKPKDDVVTIYMHWKEDYIKKGKDTPRCHVCWTDNVDKPNGWTNYDNDDEKMYLVDAKYQIYAFDIPVSLLNERRFNNVKFYYYGNGKKDENGNVYGGDNYVASNCSYFDGENWTKFIYTVNDGRRAVQTYMTYEEFRNAAAKGYENIYIVGGGDGNDNGLKIEVDGQTKDIAWTPQDGLKLNPYTAGDPVFFLKLTPKFKPEGSSDAWNARFKLTWIDVATARENNANNKTDAERDWATFDLGIIGVDDMLVAEKEKEWGDILEVRPGARYAIFDTNKSMPLLEYNQFDWVLSNKKTTSGTAYYAVVDMHPECRTVTLCTFDPQPSVSVDPGEIKTGTLTNEQAALLHSHENHLNGASNNGHILMNKVNFCEGTMTIHGVSNEVTNAARFTPTYTISMNDEDLFEHKGRPAALKLNFMPLAHGTNMGIRAMYTSDVTGLTFHSRSGNGELSGTENFKAPVASITDAKYVYDGRDYSVHANVQYSVPTTYNVYGDFNFINGSDHEICHADHEMVKAFSLGYLNGWKPNKNEEAAGWTIDNDWSSMIVDGSTDLPVLMHHVHSGVEFPLDENGHFPTLPTTTLSGEVYAVYPFLYQVHPEVTVVSSGVRARVAENATPQAVEVPADLDGFAIKNYVLSASVDKQLGNEIVSGVENVAADMAEGEAEYYTISGVRVSGQPAPGLYIMRQGNKVSKVIVK